MINLKLIAQVVLFIGAVCNIGLGFYSLAHNHLGFGLFQLISGVVLAVVFTLLLLARKL